MILSPLFFIMHLPELPTIFVKGGEERKVYFTVQARELVRDGWVEKGSEPAPKPAPAAAAKAEAKPKKVVKKAAPAPVGKKPANDASPSSIEPPSQD